MKSKSDGRDWAEDTEDKRCPICYVSVMRNRLGGIHACRLVAKFKGCQRWCSKFGHSWESKAARYDVAGKRPMKQRCEKCNEFGKCFKWDIADPDQLAGKQPNDRRAHMHSLCEACDRYGNCLGVFHEPFALNSAIQLLTGQRAEWEQWEEGLVAKVGSSWVTLKVHVFKVPTRPPRSR